MKRLDREFPLRFKSELVGTITKQIELPNGKRIEVPCGHPRADAQEFINGLNAFYHKFNSLFNQYWQNELSVLGSKHSRDLFKHWTQYQEESDDRFAFPNLAFDLYATILDAKPDKIITLANGAVRISAIAQALGFKANNYLFIHRDLDEEYRHKLNLPKETVYSGEPITPNSKVLVLEDESSLGEKRTYREARKWLAGQGVTDAPVFLERIGYLSYILALKTNGKKVEDFVRTQEELNADNCYNSFAIHSPHVNEFWSRTTSKLAEALERNQNLYDSFFKLIRSYPTK